jgi:quinol monooxygenase YgiN
MVSIEYRIDPARADEFRALMLESRRSRLSHGALSWELLRDLGEPGRFVEQIVDPSWNDHLRRFEPHHRRRRRAARAKAGLSHRRVAPGGDPQRDGVHGQGTDEPPRRLLQHCPHYSRNNSVQ